PSLFPNRRASQVNKVLLVGNLGADPEVRTTPSGMPVATLRLATSSGWTDKNGQKQEATEWHRVIVWGHQAEIISQYVTKGRQLAIEGRLQTRQWEDRDHIRRYTTEIVAQRVEMLGAKPSTAIQVP